MVEGLDDARTGGAAGVGRAEGGWPFARRLEHSLLPVHRQEPRQTRSARRAADHSFQSNQPPFLPSQPFLPVNLSSSVRPTCTMHCMSSMQPTAGVSQP